MDTCVLREVSGGQRVQSRLDFTLLELLPPLGVGSHHGELVIPEIVEAMHTKDLLQDYGRTLLERRRADPLAVKVLDGC